MQQEELKHRPTEEEGSLRELVLAIREWCRYFLSKWYIILIAGLIGGVLGLAYAFTKKPVYTATTSFVLETGGKGNALGAYAGIASSFGIDLGGGGGGLFEGENILELYKSRNMITSALLTEADFGGRRQLLVDRYIDFNDLKKNWEQKPELQNISFHADNLYANPAQQRVHDSIMGQIVKRISGEELRVEKKDKKLNIIYVAVQSGDELFAKAFNETLVKNVNDFYLETKTKKNIDNVRILQAKTDSVSGILSGSINRAAAVADATPNQNPTRMAQRIAPIQRMTANAEINKEVLGTLLENLELSKISLQKETPLIQIVDEPILPLEKSRFGRLKGIVLGGLVAAFLVFIFLVVRKVYDDAIKSERILSE